MHFQSLVVAGLAASAHAAITAQQMTSNIDAITELSSQTNNVARSIGITNFFSTAPQLINNFRQIIEIAANDVSAMGKRSLLKTKRQECLNVEDVQKCIDDLMEIIEDPSEILGDKKRGMQKRQECLNVEDVQKCIDDLMEIIEDPSEILGDKKRSFVGSSASRAVVARQSSSYSSSDQEAICESFRGFVTVHQQLLATVIGKHGLLSLTPFTQPIRQVLNVLEGGVDALAFGIIDSVPTCAQDATQNKNSLDQTLDQAINEYSS